MTLDKIREKIDNIDEELVALLEERMNCVSQIFEWKKTNGTEVVDSKREAAVLEKVAERVTNKEFEKTIVATFADIMKQSRAYQNRKLQ